jgi:integrase/recombinase XerD
VTNSKKYWESTSKAIPKEIRFILNEYLLSLKLENKAIATITKYRRILERFLPECTIPLKELTSEDIRKWLNEFSVGKKPKTIDLVLAALSSFFNFCLDEEYMETTVMKKRWRPKIPRALPKYLDEYEYARVKRISEQLPIRDRALVLFLFSSGCRVSEVSYLNIHDVNLEKRTADVIGKGKKIRHIHFSEKSALVLKDYLQTRTGDPTEPLFMNKFGQRLLVGGIQQVLKKLGKKAGLKQTFHPHCCRHTFATNMLARGADLQFIADEMGHENLNTTRIYACVPTEDMMLKYQNIMG